ncbi:MAG: Carbonic anhydrase [Syntrophorhabdus sp. PtaU1.Bin050]|nr:MAG: Carbonic anhydrase [Syntrophorhabdus sp. PtaU1.Bin050]
MSNQKIIDEALQKLIEGNKRYVAGKPLHPHQDVERRRDVIQGQQPFAVILGCSDSRIPPEIIFDQGLGDIFVIRVAGNIVDDVALGSIEYAVDHLGTKLVVVLGHGKCGAVTATVQGGEAHGHVTSIVKAIAPAVEKAKGRPGDLVDNAIKANAELVRDLIKSSKPLLAQAVSEGNISVIGAYYDIHSGEVEIV